MPALMSQSNGDVLVVYFTDSKILDEVKIQQIADELSRLVERAAGGKLLLNFHDVRFMSSAVLGKLVQLNKRCKENRVNLKLCSIAQDIMEVFKITNLHRVFDIQPDEQRALAAFVKI